MQSKVMTLQTPTAMRVSVEEKQFQFHRAGWVLFFSFLFFSPVCLPELFAAGQSPGGFAEFPGVAGFTSAKSYCVQSPVLELGKNMLLGGSLFRVTAIDEARLAERKPGGTNPDLLVSITPFSVNQIFWFVFPSLLFD